MGMQLQPGKRYRSAVCDAELVVVKAPEDERRPAQRRSPGGVGG